MGDNDWGGEGHRITFAGTPAVTEEMMRAAGASDASIARYLLPIQMACHEFDIESRLRACHFLTQVAHESQNFRRVSEIWGPTPDQLGYENRSDLGNDKPGAGGPGNGKRWMGHGLIETTGYDNHLAVANYFSVPIDQVVAWMMTPIGAARSAGFFWMTKKLNALADADDLDGITRRVNGAATEGPPSWLSRRRGLLEAIRRAV